MPTITERDNKLLIETDKYSAAINTGGYVSGVAAGSFVDKATGSRDPGFGLMIVDFLLEPGDEPPNTPAELHYPIDDAYHGNIHKRFVALPQICTAAKTLPHEITKGEGYVAVRQWFTWNIDCPPYPAGSRWEQTLLFPDGKRWFLAWDRFACPLDTDHVVMRMDMPCHVKHRDGDTFRQIYLSYRENEPDGGLIPQTVFHTNFPPDARLLYRRSTTRIPRRLIRAVQLANGTWLAGMALDPGVVYEAWCHQRDYVCMIEEFGGRKTRAGQWQSALHLAGYFDSIAEINMLADRYHGANGLAISGKGWSVVKGSR
jgi:hypothetical protein